MTTWELLGGASAVRPVERAERRPSRVLAALTVALTLLARRAARTRRAVPGQLARARRPVLTVAGFACMDVAAFDAHRILGLVVTGLSLLVLERLSGSGD